METTLKYFKEGQDPKINWEKVDKEALAMLDKARDIAGVPFIITSNYRDPAHSVEVGGSKIDAHTEVPCSAFDIAAPDSQSRLLILSGVIKAGFKRIGINAKNGHIHVDNSKKLPQAVLWIE